MQPLTKEFLEQELATKTIRQVAEEQGTYPNKIARAARKFEIVIRDRAESQKLAMSSGRMKPPMLGKKHKLATKELISQQRHNTWETQKDSEGYSDLINKYKEAFKNRDPDEKADMQQKAAKAIRATKETGSKLERFLLTKLRDHGYKPHFHAQQMLMQEDLEIDIYLPEISVAIEVDGITHDESIYGEEHLAKRRFADSKKNGLLMMNGVTVIRIPNKVKKVSQYFLNETWGKLETELKRLIVEKPEASTITL